MRFANGYGYLWVLKKTTHPPRLCKAQPVPILRESNLYAAGNQMSGTNELMTNEPMNKTMGIYGYIFKELF